jgi:hypothetical protein
MAFPLSRPEQDRCISTYFAFIEWVEIKMGRLKADDATPPAAPLCIRKIAMFLLLDQRA